jgi:hypothetical protein
LRCTGVRRVADRLREHPHRRTGAAGGTLIPQTEPSDLAHGGSMPRWASPPGSARPRVWASR